MNALKILIDKAFDFRGDVTIECKNGKQLEGYIFNRDHNQSRLQLFLKTQETPFELAYAEISDIRFTGEDTAAGKSWEEWKKKHPQS